MSYTNSDYDYLKAIEDSNKEINFEIEQVESDRDMTAAQKTKVIAELRGQQITNENSKGLFWRRK